MVINRAKVRDRFAYAQQRCADANKAIMAPIILAMRDASLIRASPGAQAIDAHHAVKIMPPAFGESSRWANIVE